MSSMSDDSYNDLNKKLANISLNTKGKVEDIYREIMADELTEYRNRLNSHTIQDCYYGLKKIRKYLNQDVSVERIQNILDLHVLNIFKQCLDSSDNDDLKYEASWIVTNMAFGAKKQTDLLIEYGIGDALIHCFYATNNYHVLIQGTS